MQETLVRVKKLDPAAQLPHYGTDGSAGADLYACLKATVTVKPGETVKVPTGLSLEIPEGCVGLIYARSGLALKQGLAPANKVGVIDSDYRGEVIIALYNHSAEERIVEHGDRIAQMVITPYVKAAFEAAEELEETGRGKGGFGSTGIK